MGGRVRATELAEGCIRRPPAKRGSGRCARPGKSACSTATHGSQPVVRVPVLTCTRGGLHLDGSDGAEADEVLDQAGEVG